MRRIVLSICAAAVLATAALATGDLATGGGALAGDTGSRILDSPSRSVIHRNEPSLRSIVPGRDLTTSRSLSGMIGDLEAAGGPGRGGAGRGGLGRGGLGRADAADDSRSMRVYDCVLHHERLERSARQLFPADCDPTADVDTGYPAHTTR